MALNVKNVNKFVWAAPGDDGGEQLTGSGQIIQRMERLLSLLTGHSSSRAAAAGVKKKAVIHERY